MARNVVWPVVLFVSVMVCVVVVVLNSNGWVPVLWEGMMIVDGEPQYPPTSYAVVEATVRPARVILLTPGGEMSGTNDAVAAQGER